MGRRYGDLPAGHKGKGRNGALLTLVERNTLYTVIASLEGKRAGLLAQAAVKGMQAHKGHVHTITFDNGLEFACHEQIAAGVGADIYLCPSGTLPTLTAPGGEGRTKTPTG